MKISLSENRITITPRKEGIVLIIDGADDKSINLGKVLASAIRPQSDECDVQLRLGALSWKDNLSDISEIVPMNMRKRGKFITPLVEGFFKDLKDKEFDLLVLSSGMVYDYDDWKEFLLSKFNNISCINVDEELKSTTLPKLKDRLETELFGKVIDEVMISFDSRSIPYRFPENFLLQFDLDKKAFSLKYPKIRDRRYTPPKKMNIEIYTRGCQAESSLIIQAGGSTLEGKIRNGEFSQLEYVHFSDNDALEIFKQHINALQEDRQETRKTYCPLCQKDETFYKPFYCQKERKYILESLDNLAKESQKIFLFISKNFEVIPSANEILEYNEGRFVFLNNEQMMYEIISRKGGFETVELPKIFRNFYKLADNGFIMLWF